LATPPDSGGNVVSGSVRLNLTGGSISNATTGVEVTSGATNGASLRITGAPAISGGVTGLKVDGAHASIVGNDLGALHLSGQSGQYILLANSAMDNQEINGTAVVFDGKTGATATLAENYDI